MGRRVGRVVVRVGCQTGILALGENTSVATAGAFFVGLASGLRQQRPHWSLQQGEMQAPPMGEIARSALTIGGNLASGSVVSFARMASRIVPKIPEGSRFVMSLRVST
jgi:hypothetical protein